MELRHASSIVPDHAFARRIAVVAGLLTAVVIVGVVVVALSRRATPAMRTAPRETVRQEKLRHAQWELDEYAGIAFANWARQKPAGACPANLLAVNAYAPHLHAVDPWGQPYQYFCTNGVFSMRAAGADGSYDTTDDLASKVPPWPRS
jgi:Type II secretion system (T2SS), protein G